MIKLPSIIGMGFSVVLSVIVPLAVIVVLLVKKKISARSVALGAISFILFQATLRIPVLNMLLPQDYPETHILFYIVIVVCSAGLVEVASRAVFDKTLLKNELGFKSALGFGLASGAAESILMAGVNMIANFSASFMINAGGGNLIETMGQESYDLSVAALANANPVEFYVVGFERIVSIAAHVMLAAAVFAALIRNKPVLTVVPFAVYAVFNFSIIALANSAGLLASEAVVLVYGVVSAVAIVKLAPMLKAADEASKSVSRNTGEKKKTDLSDYYG